MQTVAEGLLNSLASHLKDSELIASKAPTKNPPRPCAQCGKKTEHRCAGCRTVAYCCRDHQRADWSLHKPTCGLIKLNDYKLAQQSIQGQKPQNVIQQNATYDDSKVFTGMDVVPRLFGVGSTLMYIDRSLSIADKILTKHQVRVEYPKGGARMHAATHHMLDKFQTVLVEVGYPSTDMSQLLATHVVSRDRVACVVQAHSAYTTKDKRGEFLPLSPAEMEKFFGHLLYLRGKCAMFIHNTNGRERWDMALAMYLKPLSIVVTSDMIGMFASRQMMRACANIDPDFIQDVNMSVYTDHVKYAHETSMMMHSYSDEPRHDEDKSDGFFVDNYDIVDNMKFHAKRDGHSFLINLYLMQVKDGKVCDFLGIDSFQTPSDSASSEATADADSKEQSPLDKAQGFRCLRKNAAYFVKQTTPEYKARIEAMKHQLRTVEKAPEELLGIDVLMNEMVEKRLVPLRTVPSDPAAVNNVMMVAESLALSFSKMKAQEKSAEKD